MTDDKAEETAAYIAACASQLEHQSAQSWPCPLRLPQPRSAAEHEGLRLFCKIFEERGLPVTIDFETDGGKQ